MNKTLNSHPILTALRYFSSSFLFNLIAQMQYE